MTPAPHSAGEAEANPIHVARPLSVLAELIQKDLDDAEAAGMEYFKAAGEKLIEAKAQLKHGEFGAWVKTNFNISTATSARYMAMASVANLSIGINFKSQYEFRKSRGEKLGSKKQAVREQGDQERELRRKLAFEVIDAGYKALAVRLHPDKGGPAEDMTRLNEVREHLKSIYLKAAAR